MSAAAATMAMSPGAAARTACHLFVAGAFLDFVAGDRTRLFAFTRTDIFLNETRRSDRSMLSRYRIERAVRRAFIPADAAKALPRDRWMSAPCNCL